MRLIGIDPGYDRLGVAVIERGQSSERLIFSACLQSDKKKSFPERLFRLGQLLEKIIKKHQPEALALETLFFAKNRKTVMTVSETRGLILYLAGKHNLAVIECAPTTVKLTTTGYGRADKAQVASALGHLIKLTHSIKHDDEFDAIAIALTGLSTVLPK